MILKRSIAIRSNNTAHLVNVLNRILYLFHKILLYSGNDMPLAKHNKITKTRDILYLVFIWQSVVSVLALKRKFVR